MLYVIQFTHGLIGSILLECDERYLLGDHYYTVVSHALFSVRVVQSM